MFSYSIGYYVSPPDDQYLKFKNRCSLRTFLVTLLLRTWYFTVFTHVEILHLFSDAFTNWPTHTICCFARTAMAVFPIYTALYNVYHIFTYIVS